MEYRQLKNYGKLYTARPSARVMMASFTVIPRELGIIGTPKFVAKLQSKERYWRKKRFKTIEEGGIQNQETIEGIRYSLAFYTALVATCGPVKTARAYPKLAEKLIVMINEDFFPTAEDFLRCPDPWEAFRMYFLELFRVFEREGNCQFKLIQNTETDFQVHLTRCAFEAMHREGGCVDAILMGAQGDMIFFPRLAAGIGGGFTRESWICRGDATCDWHFHHHVAPD